MAIVSFNYDRCIEQFLHLALQNYFSIDSGTAASTISNIEIHHPYGKVGNLPWTAGEVPTEYGHLPTAQQLLTIATQLRTFTEGVNPTTSDINAIRRTLANSERIVFLGFAFHRLNVDLLVPSPMAAGKSPVNAVYGTSHGLSKSDTEIIQCDLSNKLGVRKDRIHVQNAFTCSELMDEYWRSLSLA